MYLVCNSDIFTTKGYFIPIDYNIHYSMHSTVIDHLGDLGRSTNLSKLTLPPNEDVVAKHITVASCCLFYTFIMPDEESEIFTLLFTALY